MQRHDRAFTLLELMVAVAVVGIAVTASFASIGNIYQEARRQEEANAAIALLKKARADALASSSGAAVETIADGDGVGVKVTVAIIGRDPAKKPCQDWKTRATKMETVRFDLLDFEVDRPAATEPNLLCFEPGTFRLVHTDGATLSPVAVDIELFPGMTTETVTVEPPGTIASTLDTSGFTEGLATTVNVMEPMPVDNMVRYIVEPDEIQPDKVIVDTVAPPAPTEPTSDPALDALPPPEPAPEPAPTGCTNNANCLVGEICSAGFCYPQQPTCLSNADCYFDEYCDGTYCVYDPYASGCGTTGKLNQQILCY
jgi:prepilin-type N-terminal cleavage/methylation domain-containing protein